MNTETKDLIQTPPRHELTLLDEMDRMFEGFFRRGWLRPFHETWPEWAALEERVGVRAPRVEVIDHEAEVVVRAEMPGSTREELQVELTGELLTIKGEKRREEKAEKGQVLQSEIAYGAFTRTMKLPPGLDLEHVKAEFKDGILEVHLPKLEKTERRTVAVE